MKKKRYLSILLAVLMTISVVPMSVFAIDMDASMKTAGFTVIDDDKSTLAPGVTMNEVVLYNSNNQRVEMYVTEVDTTVDTVQVKANYLNNQNETFGMQTLSKQVAAMEANYEEPFKIVAGINASYYNTTTGQPTGAFVMEGKDASASGDNHSFFAVLKDGTYMIGAKGEYSKYKDQMQEAIGGYHHIVIDGKVASGLDKTTLYPRQTLGLTPDGKLILMTADGSQAPQTVGMTIQEQAEVMLALGCTEAIHLDGGNSATFGAIREGTDKFVTVNSPSGYAERDVSNTLMIISTAVPSGTFDHAVITGEYEYYAPYSEYTFDAFGVDATNASAEIPESAVWTLSDDSFGTISDGKFVSNGKLGEVEIQLSDGGSVIGTKTITIVNPTSASFALEETTVPYGKSASLKVTGLYGDYDIYTSEKNYKMSVNPANAGTTDGFDFTAGEDASVTSAVVTATYLHGDSDVKDSITVKFGKGSEVLFDFEDGDISDWRGTSTIYEWIDAKNKENPDAKFPVDEPLEGYSNGIDKQYSEVFLASKENGGKVKNGKYALGFRMNHLNVTDVAGWLYNYLYYTGETKVLRDVANGKNTIRIGMWVNVPDITNVAFRIVRGTEDEAGKKGISYKYMTSDYDGKSVSYSTNYGVPESGWVYMYYDITDLANNIRQTTSLYDPDNNNGCTMAPGKGGNYYPAFLQLFTGSATDTMQDMIFYIDDITLDYSDVTEDRDAPVVSDVQVCSDTANFVALNEQTVDNNQLSFSAKVSDNSGNSNATGLDYTTAKIYVDGMDMSDRTGFKASNGNLILNDIYLTNGQHDIAFVISDNQGNETRVTKTLKVNGKAENAVVSLIGHNDGNHTPKAGSVYYIDVKASDASQIKEVVTTLKLNTANKFEYENIVCANGVTATAEYDEKDFEVTVTLKHDGTLKGDAVLASIPVRVWAWDEEATGIKAADQFKTTAIPVIDIECKSTYGAVTYAGDSYNDYACGFAGKLDVATELDNATVWHEHTVVAIEDKEASCTENGYKNRTYCEECASVIEWGTSVKPTGHVYKVTGDKLACECGEEYKENGLVEVDGNKYYILGGSLISGWNYINTDDEDTTGYYYFSPEDYQAVDGEQTIDGYEYTFVKNLLVRGTLVQTNDAIKYMWAGEWLSNSWATIDGNKYYFSSYVAKIGPSVIRGESGIFAFGEDGVLMEGKGIMNIHGRLYYYENGKCKAPGLVKIDDSYYYINANYQPVTGKYWVGKPNTEVTGFTEGEYEFAEDGKLIRQILKNGPVDGRFYINDVMQKAYQLVTFDNNYYFIGDGNKLAKDCTLYLSEKFVEGSELEAGYYEFDKDGKIVLKNGPVGEYFYINNVKQKAYQIVKYKDNYYFISDSHKIAKNCTLYLGEKFVKDIGLLAGYYEFDADGKIILKNGPVGEYFYINNVKQKAYQVVAYEDNYYFISDSNKLAKNCTLYLKEKFVDGTSLDVGYHTFDADGKIVVKNGIIGDYYYINNKKQTAYHMIEHDGNYYFINDGNKLAKNCTLYLGEKFVKDIGLSAGYYEFDADGKIVIKNGIIGDYYYINNKKQTAYQMIEHEDNYYFIGDGHKIARNCTLYLGEKFVKDIGLSAGYYEFDVNGKIVIKNGIIGDYFYINNIKQNAYQVVKYEGNYYYIGDGNKLVKNKKMYIIDRYLVKHGLPADTYSFDKDGKMLLKNGPVDGKFYIDGVQQNAYQLLKFEDSYYFIGDGNRFTKDCSIYLKKEYVYGTELSVGEYYFDSTGKLIKEQ